MKKKLNKKDSQKLRDMLRQVVTDSTAPKQTTKEQIWHLECNFSSLLWWVHELQDQVNEIEKLYKIIDEMKARIYTLEYELQRLQVAKK